MSGLTITVDRQGTRCYVDHEGGEVDGVRRVVIPEITSESLDGPLTVMVEVVPDRVMVEAPGEVVGACPDCGGSGVSEDHADLRSGEGCSTCGGVKP